MTFVITIVLMTPKIAALSQNALLLDCYFTNIFNHYTVHLIQEIHLWLDTTVG